MSSFQAIAAVVWVTMLLSAPRTLPMGTAQPLPPQATGGSGGSKQCQRKCGDVVIPYPFGFGPNDCSMDIRFRLDCNHTGGGIYKPFLQNVEVLGISLRSGQTQVMNFISSYCRDATSLEMVPSVWSWDLTITPYYFSDPGNKFIVIGCQTLAYIGGPGNNARGDGYMTGCVSFLPNGNYPTNGSCSGMGCCQTAIPIKAMKYYKVWFQVGFAPSGVNTSCNCSYAVLMDSSKFTFSSSYLTSSKFNDTYNGRAPMLLQWSIGEQSCDHARKRQEFACVSENSECVNAPSGKGYICNCSKGYDGNPYLKGQDGCTDINECDQSEEHGCFGECINEPGTFRCFCPEGKPWKCIRSWLMPERAVVVPWSTTGHW